MKLALYNCTIILYKLETSNEYIYNLSHYNKYGDIDNKNKPLIFITFANNIVFQMIMFPYKINEKIILI